MREFFRRAENRGTTRVKELFSAARQAAPVLTSSVRRRTRPRIGACRWPTEAFRWSKLTDVSERVEPLNSWGKSAGRVFSSSEPATEIWRTLGRQKSCSQGHRFFGRLFFFSSLTCPQEPAALAALSAANERFRTTSIALRGWPLSRARIPIRFGICSHGEKINAVPRQGQSVRVYECIGASQRFAVLSKPLVGWHSARHRRSPSRAATAGIVHAA